MERKERQLLTPFIISFTVMVLLDFTIVLVLLFFLISCQENIYVPLSKLYFKGNIAGFILTLLFYKFLCVLI